MAKTKAKITLIAPTEYKIEHNGAKFILKEQDAGVYGIGRSVQLYLLEGFEKKHLKSIGWTKSDNHSCSSMKDSCITSITTMDECKKAAVKYIDSLS